MALFKKILILAQGGTHGDFLYSCCHLMAYNKKGIVNGHGAVIVNPDKRNNLQTYYKGIKNVSTFNNMQSIEVCHIWQEEFKTLSANFYYIHYNDQQIDIIKKMFLEKVFKNNIELAIENKKKYLPDALAKKITKDNIDKILTVSYKNTIKKYRQQSNIKAINITDLYNFDSLVAILKDMNIYNPTKSNELKEFHNEWMDKNMKYITEMLSVKTYNKLDKYSK